MRNAATFSEVWPIDVRCRRGIAAFVVSDASPASGEIVAFLRL